MHVHWHMVIQQSHSAIYKQCRCGKRKIVEVRQDPRHGIFVVEPIDRDWVNREDGVAGHPGGPEIPTPSIEEMAGGLPPASIPSDVTFCDDLEDVRALRESIFHSVQRGDIPDEARARLYKIDHRLRKQLPDEA